jgi:hypothetical protein
MLCEQRCATAGAEITTQPISMPRLFARDAVCEEATFERRAL